MEAHVVRGLLPGELIVAKAQPHWAMFISPVLVVVFGMLFHHYWVIRHLMVRPGTLVGVYGVIWGIYRALYFWTLQLWVTNKRLIAGFGVLRRRVIDVANSKIEGVTCRRDFVGRLLGYGSIHLRGTGVAKDAIPFIDRPYQFKQQVAHALYG